MTVSIIEATSDKSFVSMQYLTVDSQMTIGPAAEYNSECIRIVSICISVCRVEQSGAARALENYSIELISKCKIV